MPPLKPIIISEQQQAQLQFFNSEEPCSTRQLAEREALLNRIFTQINDDLNVIEIIDEEEIDNNKIQNENIIEKKFKNYKLLVDYSLTDDSESLNSIESVEYLTEKLNKTFSIENNEDNENDIIDDEIPQTVESEIKNSPEVFNREEECPSPIILNEKLEKSN